MEGLGGVAEIDDFAEDGIRVGVGVVGGVFESGGESGDFFFLLHFEPARSESVSFRFELGGIPIRIASFEDKFEIAEGGFIIGEVEGESGAGEVFFDNGAGRAAKNHNGLQGVFDRGDGGVFRGGLYLL